MKLILKEQTMKDATFFVFSNNSSQCYTGIEKSNSNIFILFHREWKKKKKWIDLCRMKA